MKRILFLLLIIIFAKISNAQDVKEYFCLESQVEFYVENPDRDSKFFWEILPNTAAEIKSISKESDKVSITFKEVGTATISVYQENLDNCRGEVSTMEIEILPIPNAKFDNAQICYGENLKVIFSGTAPFILEYTLDNNLQKISNIQELEYLMPNQAGKYSITKITDKNCSSSPKENIDAIVGSQMKTLTIKRKE